MLISYKALFRCVTALIGAFLFLSMKYNEYLQKGYAKLDFNIVPRQLHVYWLCNDVSNDILRIGITNNPYFIASKIPDKTHLILFQVEEKEEAEILANSMISDIIQNGQRLFNVYTFGQANYRLRKVCNNYDLESIIQSYNAANGVNQKLFSYQGKKWICKNVIDCYILMVEYLNSKENERK